MQRLPFLSALRDHAAICLLAGGAWIATVSAIDPAGSYPSARQGPGLTIDEPFNVQQGVYLVRAVEAYGIALLHPESVREVFDGPQYLPDHPPLGRFAIGLFHELTKAVVPPRDGDGVFVVACARAAPATALAATMLLVGVIATHWYGRWAGGVAAVSVVLMPRVFGHGHVASLETFIGLAYAASALSVAAAWSGPDPPRTKTAAWTGALFGLALATKIQAVLLPLPVLAWALWRWKRGAVRPLLVWGGVGGAVFFLGWPWLWLDPVGHTLEYFGRTTQRAVLFVTYFGQRIADRDVPWHYPWVMSATTVPLGLELLAGWGMLGLGSRESEAGTRDNPIRRMRNPAEWLVLACLVFPLVVFSVPGVAVYDGARLFLVVFPLLALFVGRGSALLLEWLQRRSRTRWAKSGLAVFLGLQAYGIVALAPCELSYYNGLVGGLRGATAIGLEPTYWGESLTRSLLEDTVRRVPRGAEIAVAPVLHPLQLDWMHAQSPLLKRAGVRLVDFQQGAGRAPSSARYLLVFRRPAYLPEAVQRRLSRDDGLLAEVRRDGVRLAALYRLGARRASR